MWLTLFPVRHPLWISVLPAGFKCAFISLHVHLQITRERYVFSFLSVSKKENGACCSHLVKGVCLIRRFDLYAQSGVCRGLCARLSGTIYNWALWRNHALWKTDMMFNYGTSRQIVAHFMSMWEESINALVLQADLALKHRFGIFLAETVKSAFVSVNRLLTKLEPML